MNVSKVSNYSFKGVYLSTGLNPGKQYELGAQVRDLLNRSNLGTEYEKRGKDILIDRASKNGINIISKSKKEYELGAPIRDLLSRSCLDDTYEKGNKDISSQKNGIKIRIVRHDIKRVLDDNYQRWNGRF